MAQQDQSKVPPVLLSVHAAGAHSHLLHKASAMFSLFTVYIK